MRVWTPAPEDLDAASEALRAGQLVGIPTETVYGLAGNALDGEVVAKIFAAKERPTFDPLIAHAPTPEAAFGLAAQVPEEARRLAERFWPGPLTLVLARRADLPELLSAGLETLAVRVPAHPVAQQVLRACRLPLAAPSANRFGGISPTQASDVAEELGDRPEVAGVIDAGRCEVGLESTVVGFPGAGRVVVYRPGGVSLEALREVTGQAEPVRAADAEDDLSLGRRGERSPGMLARHYAPGTPLTLLERSAPVPPVAGRTGWLVFDRELPGLPGPQEVLSEQGDLREAAARLFACLRRLDRLGLDRIVAWKVPATGLGRAINDRLTRAARR